MDFGERVLKGVVRDYPTSPVPQLFDELLQSRPNLRTKAAFIADDQLITYQDVQNISDRIAGLLYPLLEASQDTHDSLDRVVGLLVPDTYMRASAILGIWKAAAAYVPLDAELPEDRINMIITKTQMKVILYQTKDRRHSITNRHLPSSVIKIDLDTHAILSEQVTGIGFTSALQSISGFPKSEYLRSLLVSDLLMCILTTSGSTGEPKFVPIRKSNILNRLHWYWEEFPFEMDDIGCQKTPPMFIDHLFELFAFLLKGFPIATIPRCHVRDPRAFFLSLVRYRVTRVVLVPTLLNNMISVVTPGEESQASLRMVFSEGEILPPQLAQKFLETFSNTCLINGYGSTETTANVTFEVYKSVEDTVCNQSDGYLSIGRPLPNTHVYLLDNMLRPVKEGQVGCVYAAGRNVVCGYLDPVVGIFLRNKFDNGKDFKVLYNTGDFALMKNSRLIFQGRKDATVKIRGQRVNLQEVEHAIASHPSVKSVVVSTHDVSQGIANLVAFYSCSQDLDKSEMQRHCHKILPKYMWPILVPLDEIPTQPGSGKVDRVKLIQMYKDQLAEAAVNDGDLISMDTPTKLRHVVAATIGIPTSEFSLDDNFFDIGGNSFTALAAINRMQNAECPLSVQEFFQAESLRELLERPLRDPESTLSTECSKYEVITLNEFPDKQNVIPMLARSFTEKNPLEILVGTETHHIEDMMRMVWTEVCQNVSVVVIDRQSKSAVAACLGYNIQTPGEWTSYYTEMDCLVKGVENPVMADLLTSGEKWFESAFNGCDPALPNDTSMLLIEMMELRLFTLARDHGYDGIVTTDVSPAIAVSMG